MVDQSARRAVQCFAAGFALDARGKPASQLLAEFNAPLVEGIQVPQDTEAEDLVLIECNQLAEAERGQFGQDDRR